MPLTRTIDINDTKHRYYLGRETTIAQLQAEHPGTTIRVVGKYYPNRAMATPSAPCLQLHITCPNEGEMATLTEWLEDVVRKGPPASAHPKQLVARVPLGFGCERNHQFAVRNALQGPHNGHLKFIHLQTGAQVHIKGRGSGISTNLGGRQWSEEEEKDMVGVESNADVDEMHFELTAYRPEQVEQARALVLDLCRVVHFEYAVSTHLGYFSPLGGLMAPDSVLRHMALTLANASANGNAACMSPSVPHYYPSPAYSSGMAFPYAAAVAGIRPPLPFSALSPPPTIPPRQVRKGRDEDALSLPSSSQLKKPKVNDGGGDRGG
jgi:hypothetical protein